VTNNVNLKLALIDLYAAYADCLDQGRFDDWPDFFTEDCRYRVVPRENHERGLPLSTMDLQGTGMLRDRAYAVQSTLFHAPYYQRHVIGPARIVEQGEGFVETQANYLVISTKRDEMSELFNAGRYLDRIATASGRLLFAEKICVYDSELIPNSMIYPI
jgi:salicylate 5-hydroxylase small subunit